MGGGTQKDQWWSASTTYLCWLCHSPSPDKEDYFVRFFVVAFLPATMCVLSLSLSLMACTQGFQLILTSFGRYVIPARHFSQKSLSRNLRIGFLLSSSSNHTFLPLTYDPLLPVLAGYRLVMSGPYACSTPIYIQNLSAAHVFAVIWRLIYVFCLSSLTPYGVNCFLISHSLQLASFKGQALPGCGLSLLEPILCSFHNPTTIFCHTILLFLPWYYLTRACQAPLVLLLILLPMTRYGHWFYTHAILGFSWPISLLVGSFVPFLSS